MIDTSPDDGAPAQMATPRRGKAALTRSTLPLLSLACAGVLLQLSWLLLWPLSYRLTHGTAFTYTYLAGNPLVRELLDTLTAVLDRLAPGFLTQQDLAVKSLVAVLVLAGLGYVAGVLLLDNGFADQRGAGWLVVGFTLLFQVTLFFMPGIFTTDIFSYLIYGQIAGEYHMNPYVDWPSDFRESLVLPWIPPIWQSQPSVYGPLWTDVGWVMAKVTRSLPLVDQVLAYKLLMNVVHVMSLGLVWWLLGRFSLEGGSRRARLTAFTLFAWNPLILFEVTGNAHNDGLMVFLLLLSLAPFAASPRAATLVAVPQKEDTDDSSGGSKSTNVRWVAACVIIGLSALIKYTTIVAGLFYAAAWARGLPTWRSRVLWLGASGLLVLTITLGLFLPWLSMPDALEPIANAAGGKLYLNSVPDLLALGVAHTVLDPTGDNRAAAEDTARFWMKAITRALFLVYLAWELRRVWLASAQGQQAAAYAVIRASARAFCVLILLVLTWVLEWYFTWPMALVSLLGWRNALSKVVVGYTLTSLPIFYLHHYWQWQIPHTLILLYALLPLSVPAVEWLQARRRTGQARRGEDARGPRRLPELSAAMLPALLVIVLAASSAAPATGSVCSGACARAQMVMASPSPNARLSAAPTRVELLFSEELLPSRTTVVVLDASSAIVSGPAAVETLDSRRVAATLAPGLAPGRYTVRWHSLASGYNTELDGSYTFFTEASPGPQPQLTLFRDFLEAGQAVVVTGAGFAPRTPVSLFISDDQEPLGSTRTDADGWFGAHTEIPTHIPSGEHAVLARDANGVTASASLLVYGGWPPLKLSISGSPGPGRDEVTFTVSGRNRSDYILEDVRLRVPIPRDAALVSASHSGRVVGEAVIWEGLPALDRTSIEPRSVTLRVSGPVSTRAWAEFQHRDGQVSRGEALPAFLGAAVSADATIRP